jgi:hypothetical protein
MSSSTCIRIEKAEGNMEPGEVNRPPCPTFVWMDCEWRHDSTGISPSSFPQEDLNEAVVRRTLARAWSMRQHR